MSVAYAVRSGRALRCLAAAGLVAGAALTAVTMNQGAAAAADAPSAGTIHPGATMTSPQGQCTANFVFTVDGDTYLGQAAHCTGTGNASETDGCTSKSAPLGTEIKIAGASRPGKLAYSSWLTMQRKGERDPNACAYNDFALVKIDPADEDKVTASVPRLGGPSGLHGGTVPAGSTVYSYQNSDLRQGLMSAKQGLNLGDSANGWSHEVATITPGVPGDSGSGFMDANGQAFGVLSTLNLQPAPGTNGVSDLAKMIGYADDNGDLGDVELSKGAAFHPSALPIA